MKSLRKLSILVPAAVLIACLIGLYLTRDVMAHLPFLMGAKWTPSALASGDLVDLRPWQTIEALAPLALSAEEKRLAREAQRLADHEVDQAFAQALRQATLETRTLGGDALALQQKVISIQALIKEDKARVDSLTAASKGANPPGTDDLDIAKAQLQLDTDRLDDAAEDLANISGDKRSQIQQELATREAAMKKFDEQGYVGGPSTTQTARRYGSLFGRINSWLDQRSRMGSIALAQAQANSDAAALTASHADIDRKLNKGESSNAQNTEATSRVIRLAQLHSLAQIHSLLEDRIQTQKQLAVIYGRWIDQVKRQHQIVTHLILRSIALISFVLLCAVLIAAALRRLLARLHLAVRTLQTMRTISDLAVQFFTALLILLIIFGVPNQMPTIIGLATAGLTVAFQDFILAFLGWFILMGQAGIRVGDWVEINGVGGEVAEIGLFRTSLFETGNWTGSGHPTGRRVNFMNGFAIRGQYFNFSTSGQWLWDEIRVNIPASSNTYETIEAIHKAVVGQTEDASRRAEAEWRRTTGVHSLSQFNASPSVDMRPAASGIDIIVRYVTSAGERFNLRNRIYQTVIDLLQKSGNKPVLASGGTQS